VTSRKRVAGQPNVNGAEYSALQFSATHRFVSNGGLWSCWSRRMGCGGQRSEADGLADRILPASSTKYSAIRPPIQKVFRYP